MNVILIFALLFSYTVHTASMVGFSRMRLRIEKLEETLSALEQKELVEVSDD